MTKTKGKTEKTRVVKSKKEVEKSAKQDKGAADIGEKELCLDCKKRVLENQQGLKCDSCGNWYHSECQDILEEIFDFLQDHADEPSLQWCCKRCLDKTKKEFEVTSTMQLLDERFSTFADAINKQVGELAGIINKIQEKLDTKEPQNKEETQELHKRVEEKVDKLMMSVEKQRKLDGHMVHDCVEEVVKIKLREDEEEIEELKKRKTSVIIHGLEESKATNPVERKTFDENLLTDLLHEIKCDNVSIRSVIRLGRKEEDNQAKPRPVKVTIASEEQTEQVLTKAKNLHGRDKRGLNIVFIHQDLTPNQRKQRAALVQILKQRQSQGEQNLIIVQGKIVVRRTAKSQETLTSLNQQQQEVTTV